MGRPVDIDRLRSREADERILRYARTADPGPSMRLCAFCGVVVFTWASGEKTDASTGERHECLV